MISFPLNKECEDPSRDVISFPAINNNIKCAISREAINDHFGGISDILNTFKANRSTIEAKAISLIQKGRYEPDGSILIRTADF